MWPDTFIWIISLAGIFGVLFRPWNIAEAWWACGGALLLVATTLISLGHAGSAVLKGADVYLFLAGMMALSDLAREAGVFDWIAGVAAGQAKGSPKRLFLLVYLAGTMVTIFLSNDATAVVLTPAVLTIVRHLKVKPVPHLLACALIANAASFVLPISNPANLVIYGSQMPPLLSWLGMFLLPSFVAIALTFFALYFLSRNELADAIETKLSPTKLSVEGRFALGGLGLAAAVLIIASALGWNLGAPTLAAALVVTALLTLRNKAIPGKIMRGVSWSVLPLVAGLFVIVEALQGAGMLRVAVAGLHWAEKTGGTIGNLATAFTVALASNGMNNLPVGLISGAAVHSAHVQDTLGKAVLVGVDLGPNLSVAGSLATILWLIALRREQVKITGWQFFKVGVVVMPVALLGSVLVLKK